MSRVIVPSKLDVGAKLPTYMTDGSAGMDMYSSIKYGNVVLKPQTVTMVKTGVSMAIPQGYYGQIASRSGLCIKRTIWAVGGVIDSDYRGEIGVLMYNGGSEDVVITPGERVAQIIFLPCMNKNNLTLQLHVELPSTERGSGGFGSTGKS
jgi:dUTP pyrophosphatase